MSVALKEAVNENALKLRRVAGRIGAEVQDFKITPLGLNSFYGDSLSN